MASLHNPLVKKAKIDVESPSPYPSSDDDARGVSSRGSSSNPEVLPWDRLSCAPATVPPAFPLRTAVMAYQNPTASVPGPVGACLPPPPESTLDPAKKPIACGGYGAVFRGKLSVPGVVDRIDVAVKVHSQNALALYHAPYADANMRDEMAVMYALQGHPNILRLIGRTEEPVGVVMEFIVNRSNGATLGKWLSLPDIPFGARVSVACQISAGLRYMHHKNYLHGDIKTDNVLVTDQGGTLRAVVSDFGTTAHMNPFAEKGVINIVGPLCIVSEHRVGTLGHIAPEGFLPAVWGPSEDRVYVRGPGSDVWTFGMLLSRIFRGTDNAATYYPMSRMAVRRLERTGARIASGDQRFNVELLGTQQVGSIPRMNKSALFGRPSYSRRVEPFFLSLIHLCMRSDPLERPSFVRIEELMQNHRGEKWAVLDTDGPTPMVDETYVPPEGEVGVVEHVVVEEAVPDDEPSLTRMESHLVDRIKGVAEAPRPADRTLAVWLPYENYGFEPYDFLKILRCLGSQKTQKDASVPLYGGGVVHVSLDGLECNNTTLFVSLCHAVGIPPTDTPKHAFFRWCRKQSEEKGNVLIAVDGPRHSARPVLGLLRGCLFAQALENGRIVEKPTRVSCVVFGTKKTSGYMHAADVTTETHSVDLTDCSKTRSTAKEMGSDFLKAWETLKPAEKHVLVQCVVCRTPLDRGMLAALTGGFDAAVVRRLVDLKLLKAVSSDRWQATDWAVDFALGVSDEVSFCKKTWMDYVSNRLGDCVRLYTSGRLDEFSALLENHRLAFFHFFRVAKNAVTDPCPEAHDALMTLLDMGSHICLISGMSLLSYPEWVELWSSMWMFAWHQKSTEDNAWKLVNASNAYAHALHMMLENNGATSVALYAQQLAEGIVPNPMDATPAQRCALARAWSLYASVYAGIGGSSERKTHVSFQQSFKDMLLSHEAYVGRKISVDPSLWSFISQLGVSVSEGKEIVGADTAVEMSGLERAVLFSCQSILLQWVDESKSSTLYAGTWYSLGKALDNLGLDAEALQAYQKALDVCIEAGGERSPEVVKVLFSVAGLHHKKGRHAEALDVYGRCMSVCDHFTLKADLAKTYSWRAIIKYAQKDFEGSLEDFRTCLNLRLEIFGIDVDTAAALNNMAIVTNALVSSKTPVLFHGTRRPADLKDVAECYEQCLAVREECLGDTDEDVAHSLDNLAVVLFNMGKKEEPLLLLERCDRILKTLGLHEKRAVNFYKRGVVAVEGDVEKAIGFFVESLNIRQSNASLAGGMDSFLKDVSTVLNSKALRNIQCVRFFDIWLNSQLQALTHQSAPEMDGQKALNGVLSEDQLRCLEGLPWSKRNSTVWLLIMIRDCFIDALQKDSAEVGLLDKAHASALCAVHAADNMYLGMQMEEERSGKQCQEHRQVVINLVSAKIGCAVVENLMGKDEKDVERVVEEALALLERIASESITTPFLLQHIGILCNRMPEKAKRWKETFPEVSKRLAVFNTTATATGAGAGAGAGAAAGAGQ